MGTVTTTTAEASPATDQHAAEVAHAWTLRTAGLTFRRIAAELGLPLATARRRVVEGAQAAEALALLDRTEARTTMAGQLDHLAEALNDRLTAGVEPEVIAPVLLRVMDRRARLLGLDAPARVLVDTPPSNVDPRVLAAIRAAQRRSSDVVVDGQDADE